MLEYLKGPLKTVATSYVIVEAGGFGYRVFLPHSAFAKLPHIEEPVWLYLSEVIREDMRALYGFLCPSSRDLFESLREVSGIGPKSALALVGFSPEIETLLRAIQTSDIGFISRAPGIGKKTAERLIVEMKDKVPKLSLGSSLSMEQQDLTADGVNALLNLGYSPQKASTAIKSAMKKLPDTPDLSALITTALQCLAN